MSLSLKSLVVAAMKFGIQGYSKTLIMSPLSEVRKSVLEVVDSEFEQQGFLSSL